MNIRHKSGEVAELYVAMKLVELGYTVLWPHGTQTRYDLAVEKAGSFNRVQIKKASWSKTGPYSYLQARISSRNKNSRPKYEKGEFEVFIFTDLERIWIAPFEALEGYTSVCLDSTNPKYKRQTKYDPESWLT